MNTAEDLALILENFQAQGLSKAATVTEMAVACLGWPYVFGAIGEMCTPKNRDRRVNASYPTIVSKCQVLSGKAKECTGCEWGQGVRMFDCRLHLLAAEAGRHHDQHGGRHHPVR